MQLAKCTHNRVSDSCRTTIRYEQNSVCNTHVWIMQILLQVCIAVTATVNTLGGSTAVLSVTIDIHLLQRLCMAPLRKRRMI